MAKVPNINKRHRTVPCLNNENSFGFTNSEINDLLGYTDLHYTENQFITHVGSFEVTVSTIESVTIYILETNGDEEEQLHTILHEFGHAFGYCGHNQNTEVVMYNYDNDITTLTNSDKDHIRQLYDYLRMYEE